MRLYMRGLISEEEEADVLLADLSKKEESKLAAATTEKRGLCP